jgi:S1-C subfamily serine protease|uniref:S1C family serine protease n=1 Tax=Orrella sp. TaxID=1921583 RepID=UPI004047A79C
MKRATLYSRSSQARDLTGLVDPEKSAPEAENQQSSNASVGRSRATFLTFIKRPLFVLGLGVFLVAAIIWQLTPTTPATPSMVKANVEAIVLETLATKSLPARAAQVAAAAWPSVVSIQTLDGEPPTGNLIGQKGKGAGFVIKDDGSILTNYHVIAGSERIVVTFADGMVSPAAVVSLQPERDLAVLQPAQIPDDLQPVTLAASGEVRPGDLVVAVGFPFGMGPSVSAGVVSGLNRSFPLPGRAPLTGLIQFDAAVNPGSSGGPLLNQDGEVVGVVTAILNPSPGGTFAGVGFAITMESAANAAGIPPF